MTASRPALLLASALLAGLPGPVALAGATSDGNSPALSEARTRLTLTLPAEIAGREPVLGPLEVLARERCDQAAIADLGRALEGAGWRRDAARAHIAFSATCGGHAPSLRAAVNILLGLSDYPQAASVAGELIKLEPFVDDGYVLRALAYEKGSEPRQAIDDYTTAIELFADRDQISSASYLGMARAYEKLGQPCDALGPIQAWVAVNPARNDTGQTRGMIAGYRRQGSCAPGAAGKTEVFSLARGHAVVPVAINGVKGNFLIDTGSTFVALRASFAAKASVVIDPKSLVLLNTANGVTQGRRGRAATVALRSLKSADVPVVVQSDAKATYGSGVDGLLGMSFLSRFDLTMSGKTIKVAARGSAARATAAPRPRQ